VKRATLEALLSNKFILYGEWLYAKHSVFYRNLPHYFFEFDIYDKDASCFFGLDTRLAMLEGTGLNTVPVLHRGPLKTEQLLALIGPSKFDSDFENPVSRRNDNLMEGLYLRTEKDGRVTGRAKIVRPEFVEKVKQSEHWQHQAMIPNQLALDADIWS
jgi:hypothetical protein